MAKRLLDLLGVRACEAKPPELLETFSVTGEVRDAAGKSLANGLVQFEAVSAPAINTSSPIQDGKYSLRTAFAAGAKDGAPAGKYHVTVVPPFDLIPKPIRLRDEYEVTSKPNELHLRLP